MRSSARHPPIYPPGRRGIAGAFACLAALAGCVDLGVEDRAFRCTGDRDCIAGYACHPVRRVCVTLAALADASPSDSSEPADAVADDALPDIDDAAPIDAQDATGQEHQAVEDSGPVEDVPDAGVAEDADTTDTPAGPGDGPGPTDGVDTEEPDIADVPEKTEILPIDVEAKDAADPGPPPPDTCECSADSDCAPPQNPCVAGVRCEACSCVSDPSLVPACGTYQTPKCFEAVCDPSSGACVLAMVEDETACDAGDPCSLAAWCLGGMCTPKEVTPCDDGNPCTSDQCIPAYGCVHAPNVAPCDDGDPCTVFDYCFAGKCQGGVSLCPCMADADCSPLSAADKCAGPPVCETGGGPPHECGYDAAKATACEADGSGCTTGVCSPSTGACGLAPANHHGLCVDADACTTGTICASGACTGGRLVSCDDGNECTVDTCDAEIGCQHWSAVGPCDDGNPCTVSDTCAGGLCAGTNVCSCGSGGAEPAGGTGCEEHEDESWCNGTLVCVSGKCEVDPATVVKCPQPKASPCKQAVCLPEDGSCETVSLPDGTPCVPASLCALPGVCAAGKCVSSGPLGCDDQNPCTADECDPGKACLHEPQPGPCDDGDPCTADDHCLGGSCTGGAFVCDCRTDIDCAGKEDGNACNGTLRCEAASCVVDPSTVVACPEASALPCHVPACNPATGKCVVLPGPTGTPCEDGNPCTSGDACFLGKCIGDPLDCDDGNPCTADLCAGATGKCVHISIQAVCDDGLACTKGDHCEGGKCVAASSKCACGSDEDCSQFDDGDPCNGTLSCTGGLCAVGGVVVCEKPLSACGATTCSPATGKCETKPLGDGAPCDDGDLCTVGDTCHQGACAGLPLPCSDGNECTEDCCDPSKGCSHTPLAGAPCEDGNACTAGDTCQAGSCKPGATVGCDDGKPCTQDTCVPSMGCVHLPSTGTCTDGDPCTVGDSCAGDQCLPGPDVCCQGDEDCPPDGDLCDGLTTCDTSATPSTCAPIPGSAVECKAPPGGCQMAACEPSTGKCLAVLAVPLEKGDGCCASVEDCPDPSAPPACDDLPSCQGHVDSAACIANRCEVIPLPNDSACGESMVALECGLFDPRLCTGDVDQEPPVCPDACTADDECVEGSYCPGGACVPK